MATQTRSSCKGSWRDSIDFRQLTQDILAALGRHGVEALYRQWGFRPRGVLTSKGWLNGHAIDRDDKHPSAGINLDTGRYHDFMTGETLSLFDAAAKFCPHRYADWLDAKRQFAADCRMPFPGTDGAALPRPRPAAQRPFPAAPNQAEQPSGRHRRRVLRRHQAFYRRMAKQLAAVVRRYAKQLGVSEESLDRLGAGVRVDTELSLPMRDGEGRLVGIARRLPDGSKRCVRTSALGLFYGRLTALPAGVVPVVEGASDVAALRTRGIIAVGRSNSYCTVNVGQLVVLFRRFPDATLLVVGENDRKADGSWPGREGAERMARELAEKLGRPAYWALVPDGAKDTRAWFNARGDDLTDPTALKTSGEEYAKLLCEAAVKVDPPSRPERGGGPEGAALARNEQDELPQWFVPDCPRQAHVRYRRKDNGHVQRVFDIRCGCHACRHCGYFTRINWRGHLAGRFADHETIYSFEVRFDKSGDDKNPTTTEKAWKALTRYIDRKGGEFAILPAVEGGVIVASRYRVYATVFPRAKNGNPAILAGEVAALTARQAADEMSALVLSIPLEGSERCISTSKGWKPRWDERHSTGEWEWVGKVENLDAATLGAAARECGIEVSTPKLFHSKGYDPSKSRVADGLDLAFPPDWSAADIERWWAWAEFLRGAIAWDRNADLITFDYLDGAPDDSERQPGFAPDAGG
jgi:hypothetical protein